MGLSTEQIIKLIKIMLTEGIEITLYLFAATLILALPLGILLAFGRLSRFKIISGITFIYTWIFRGSPLLLQLIFIYYALPKIPPYITLDMFPAALVAFALNYAAYFAEIFRAGIKSIDKGQYEASDVLGLSKKQTFFKIIGPQMVKRVLPPLSNEVITLVKDTSLVYALGMTDLLRVAKDQSATLFNMTPYAVAAVFYLAMTFVIQQLFRYLEKRFDYYR